MGTEPAASGPQRPAERVRAILRPEATDASEAMAPWRVRLHDIIFEADTPSGKLFDVVLLVLILLSVVAVSLESVQAVQAEIGPWLRAIEWTLTVLFTVEYVLRIVCVRRPLGYTTSFFGVVDLLSVLPTYLSLFFAGTQALIVVRTLRLLRVFRVYQLHQFVGAAEVLLTALAASRAKIVVFLGSVLTLVVIIGSVMFLVEGPENGFTSIPRSIYWSVVTLTTVGYGDIAPRTVFGQGLAALVMILGYGIIAVPTGIVSVELAEATRGDPAPSTSRSCPDCSRAGHDQGASFCKHCGGALAQTLHKPGAGS